MNRTAARFVIYAQGRTGSHLLMQLLQAHPQLQCEGEVLNRQHWPGLWQWGRRAAMRAPDLYLPWRARDAKRMVWGCKVPIATSARGLARLATDGWTVLFLQRRSRFDRALSWCVASLTGEFQRSGAPRPDTITVPLDLFRSQLAFRRHWDERSQHAMQSVPHVPLVYEEDLAQAAEWERTCAMLFDQLALPRVAVRSDMRRSFDRPYHELVMNFEQLRELYEQTDAGDSAASPS